MGDVAEVIGGGTPKTSRPEYFGGDVSWITPADLSGYTSKFISRGTRNITIAGLNNSGARLMPAGTVLFSSRAPIGYVAIATNPVSTNQGFKSFVLKDGLIPDYVYYWLKVAKKFAVGLASGTTFPEISGKKAAQIPIPVAPFDEQRRIVAELETQLTRLDASVTALIRVQANVKRYRASVLKAACEGRLVPTEAELARLEGRTYESGAGLLARILNDRRAKWGAQKGKATRKRDVEPQPLNISGLPTSPPGWEWASLEQLAWSASYGTSVKCTYDNDGPPVIRIPNVCQGRLDYRDLKFAPAQFPIEHGEELTVGDLLVIRTNGSKSLIGRSCVVLESPEKSSTYASYLIRFRLLPESTVLRWIAAFWDSMANRTWIEHRAATSAGQHNISLSVLNSLPVPLPPLEEQKRIVAEVERCLSVIEELEAAVTANLKRSSRLRAALLNQMFGQTKIGR